MLSGGGARAAYQVGVLRYLARKFPNTVPDILTGVSAGGINAAFIAARQEPYPDKIEQLAEMWRDLHIDQVFNVDIRDLAWRSLRWSGRLASGGSSPLPNAKSLVDTTPLRQVLERELGAGSGPIPGIQTSFADGWLRAFAITGSSYTTGQSITWVQTREDGVMPSWERPARKSHCCPLRVDHVMASAALPFFFPAIEVDGAWYGDGGIRLTAPLSPAIHLGAKKILAVTTRYTRTREEADRADDYRLSAACPGRRCAVQRDLPRSARWRRPATADGQRPDRAAARRKSGKACARSTCWWCGRRKISDDWRTPTRRNCRKRSAS